MSQSPRSTFKLLNMRPQKGELSIRAGTNQENSAKLERSSLATAAPRKRTRDPCHLPLASIFFFRFVFLVLFCVLLLTTNRGLEEEPGLEWGDR